jgi:hypothetical protein
MTTTLVSAYLALVVLAPTLSAFCAIFLAASRSDLETVVADFVAASFALVAEGDKDGEVVAFVPDFGRSFAFTTDDGVEENNEDLVVAACVVVVVVVPETPPTDCATSLLDLVFEVEVAVTVDFTPSLILLAESNGDAVMDLAITVVVVILDASFVL